MERNFTKARKRRPDGLWFIHAMPNGAEIRKAMKNSGFDVFDAQGRWLGMTGTWELAVAHAEKQSVLMPETEPISDLTFWTLWNEAVDLGVRVLALPGNKQAIALDRETFLVVDVKDRLVELVDIDGMWERFSENGVSHMTICDEPIKLY